MTTFSNTIKALIKKIILFLPKGEKILAWISQKRNRPKPVHPVPVTIVESSHLEVSDPKSLFTSYYYNNFWGNPESASGAGSTLKYTENIRKEIPLLVERFEIRKFLDAFYAKTGIRTIESISAWIFELSR